MKLSEQQLAVLADGYESDFYKVMQLMMKDAGTSLGVQMLSAPADVVTISRMQGKAAALKELHQELKTIHAKVRGAEPVNKVS